MITGYEDDITGKGTLIQVLEASPGAGVDNISFTVPIGEYWEIQALRTIIVTDGTVAQRQLRCEIGLGGGGIQYQSASDWIQDESITAIYQFALNSPEKVSLIPGATLLSLRMPQIRLHAEDTISLLCSNFQAADQYGQTILTYLRYKYAI